MITTSKLIVTSAKYLVAEALNTSDIALVRADICTELVQYPLRISFPFPNPSMDTEFANKS